MAGHQISAIAVEKSQDVILVTDDVKEDWWHYEGSRLVGPLPALRKEFLALTGRSIWLYTTEGFLRAAKEFVKVDISAAALKEVSAALNIQSQQRFQRYLKLTTDKIRLPLKSKLDDVERGEDKKKTNLSLNENEQEDEEQ
ncbi:PIN-like domain-containing protein [Rhizobium tubonense]|uniref:PIN like domain-containing protein n=1 Tax=Rhizobium tubonense TaxID=484088 RepID=A0A2W4CII8_9HYPH|nr:PIN-like domain-containing protein [Rhizobium tubonense]PZM12481.1 hypothetical protein CPY51_17020 [Rhizobium tubonense]